MSEAVLSVRELVTSFPIGGRRVAVVDGVNLSVAPGEVLALVGESGCGKSVTALSILRLVPRPGHIDGGCITLCGRDILSLAVKEMRGVRGGLGAMIFQEPMTSLNPVQSVGDQVVEALRLHERVSKAAARARVAELFERVRIPDAAQRLTAFPHQLSGGLQQRVMIAMALALRPRLLAKRLRPRFQVRMLRPKRRAMRASGMTILAAVRSRSRIAAMACAGALPGLKIRPTSRSAARASSAAASASATPTTPVGSTAPSAAGNLTSNSNS